MLHLPNQRCRSHWLTTPFSSLQPSFLPRNLLEASFLRRAYFAPALTVKPVPYGAEALMVRKPCSPSKSADLLHWFCSPCQRSVIIRDGSVLKGKKVSCGEFVSLLFWFSTKGISGSTISEFTQRGHCFDLEGGSSPMKQPSGWLPTAAR